MNAASPFELRKFVVPEFVYGRGAMELVGRYARNFGARNALVVTDAGVVAAGWTERALASLRASGVASTIFSDVTPNPKAGEVAAGVRAYRDAGCDVIVAVGGGSPMDCAKGIGIAHANDTDVRAFEGIDEVPTPGPPLICVPTTAGSSADVSQFAIINDTTRHLKIAIVSKTVVADAALIDPETTTTMPAELTAATGFDALVHAIEAYVSNASSPITDMNALEAVALLAGNLAAAVHRPDDMDVRHNMMLGSLLAGIAFSNASLGLVHAMAHALGGQLDLPHGLCNSALLQAVVAFNYPAVPERYDRIAAAMGLGIGGVPPAGRVEVLLRGMEALRHDAGIATTIGGLGVDRGAIARLAANAVNDPCLATNPRPASAAQIEALYEQAL
ncbi:MAG TPA: alcohol dehydrogenase-like regulatory protein ErcA [Rhodocyclaceae bacterium]